MHKHTSAHIYTYTSIYAREKQQYTPINKKSLHNQRKVTEAKHYTTKQHKSA